MTCAWISIRRSVMARCAATPRICERRNEVPDSITGAPPSSPGDAARRSNISLTRAHLDRPNILVTATAIVYFVASIATIFAGEELLAAFQARRTVLELALIQLLGAALFGFAMLNWFHRY